ncbi:lipoprotein-releasing system permease protein [Cyclobacterium lianum]|uniref:Lipoprotein-releasing system permease protein n=1 Tax=Cyclobacterium lianum TaxID=388280 RepID=A0A1M7MLA3_9BACT|nr:FtsX-like permease family protein [Cyclobacterium lianum]SHM91238.1 lipoprotein-releasing system permease protein [Cyclobacterium lianum]
MNLSYFIAKRISFKKTGGFTGTIHRIAVASIALGLSIMIISFLILGGFQAVISNKVFSFTGHYQVNRLVLSQPLDESPSSKESNFYTNYSNLDKIRHVQVYANKPGLIKGEDEVEGVMMKGVGPGFDSLSFKSSLVEGRFIRFDESGSPANEIVISTRIARKMLLDVGDRVTLYFVQDPPRFRRMEVVGLYETFLEDFDDKIVIGDIQVIRVLNDWDESQVGGFEVFLKDPGDIDTYEEALYDFIDYDLRLVKATDKFIQIFDWLELLNNNVYVFLALILFVAAFNMVSILFILIMERTPMIGLLKALGARNRQVRNIFIWNGIRIIGRGMLLGNLIGLGFGWLQEYTRIIKLNPENYYMSFVPVYWNWPLIAGLNLLILIITTAVLFIPAMITSNVNPIKSIKFD